MLKCHTRLSPDIDEEYKECIHEVKERQSIKQSFLNDNVGIEVETLFGLNEFTMSG